MSDLAPILFVAHTGRVSGAEKMLLSLVDEALRTGHRVTVASPVGRLTELLPGEAAHLTIPELGMGGEQGAARIVSAARMLGRWAVAGRILRPATRVAGTATVVNSLFALPAARLARPPRGVSWLVHDAVASTRQAAVTRLCRNVVRSAVACTEAAAAPVATTGVPITVVPYGVPWPVPRLGGPLHDPPVIGTLALLTPWKGHRVLLDAVASVPDVVLELAGDTFPGDQEFAAELRTRASRPDLDGRVRFLGHVDLEVALRAWDVVVSASVLPEAGPLSVLEAMSYGLPVIATDHGGPSEFLSGGGGVLVPPDDAPALTSALSAVLTDEAMRTRLGDAARRDIANEHDISVTSPLLLRALTTG